MYIYNLTAVIDESVFEAWQQWLAHCNFWREGSILWDKIDD